MFQVGYFLIRNAKMYPDRLAVVFEEKTVTYLELNKTVNRLANHLKALGIKKGDRLAYLFSNSLEIVSIWYAAQKIGATAVPVNTHLLADEIVMILKRADCQDFVYQESFRDRLSEVKLRIPNLRNVICCGQNLCKGEVDFKELCRSGDETEAQIHLEGSDESLLLFTSGTTGVSKGVVRSQQMVRDYALMMAAENGSCHRYEILLTHCPMFHTAGMSLLMKMAALSGTLILSHKVKHETMLKQIERYGITQILMIPPNLYQGFLSVPNWQSYDLSSVQEAQCSGGKCTMDYARSMFQIFPACSIRLSWGSTETCAPTSAVLTREQLEKDPGLIHCVGQVNSMVELRLIDDRGKDVGDGEVGEAIVRSPMVFTGYLNQPELSAASIKDGWFYTEDLMKRDHQGYYYLVDRKRDIIKTGGENVYAQEVEQTLSQFPAIEDCAVISVPDARFNEAVAAVLVLKKGEQATIDEIIEFCRQRLPGYKKPRYITFVEKLPRNSLGKLQKNILRQHYRELFGIDLE